jgi:hypothetical protein
MEKITLPKKNLKKKKKKKKKKKSTRATSIERAHAAAHRAQSARDSALRDCVTCGAASVPSLPGTVRPV